MKDIDLAPLGLFLFIIGGCAVVGLGGAIIKGILMVFGVDVSWM